MTSALASPASATSVQQLAINDVLDYCGKVVRLIAANPVADIAYLIEIGASGETQETSKCKKALPFPNSFRHLRAEGVRLKDWTWACPLSPSLAAQSVRAVRYERIRELLANPCILDAKTRGRLLRSHAVKVGVSKKTLLNDLRVWWQRGQVKDALMGNYHRLSLIHI